MNDVIITGIQFLVLFCQGFLLQDFFGRFLEKRFCKGRWGKLGVIFLYGVILLVVDACLPEEYGLVRILGKKIFTVLSISIILAGVYKSRGRLRLFLLVTFLAVSDICFFLAYMLMQAGTLLNEFWLELFENGYFATNAQFMMTLEISMMLMLLIMYLAFLLLTGIALRRLANCFREKDYLLERREVLFLITPGMVGFLLCLLLRLIMITVEDGRTRILYDRYPVLIVLVPAIMMLVLLSIIYSVKLFQDMVAFHRERNSRMILEAQIAGLQEHVKEVERIHEGVRSMKHDMRNTLSVVMQLAEKGAKNSEVQVYLSELNQDFDKLESRFHTGNTVADTLLNMKYYEVKQSIPNLQMECEDLVFPEKLQIQSYDLGIILGNALDNAIEACRKSEGEDSAQQAFIRISSFRKGKMFFIEVENSFAGTVLRNPGSEFPVTDKEDRNSHGMGFMNMKNTAEKYHGGVDWSVNGKVFTLTIMMQNEKEVRKC